MKRHSSQVLYPLGFFVIILILWNFISSFGKISFWILPSPLDVLKVFFTKADVLSFHLGFTLRATLLGFFISLILGVFVAILMDLSQVAKQTIYPYIVISQTIPVIAVAPLIIVWLGYGLSSKVFTVVLTCFFPIALNFFDGLTGVSIDKIRLLHSMGAGKLTTMRYLKIPNAMPNLFTGLKISATYSVMGAVIGEWLGGTGGLGIYMTRAAKSFDIEEVFAVILVVVLLSLALFWIVTLAERIFVRWNSQKIEEYEEIYKSC